MKKKKIIKEIKYDDLEKSICIKRYNNKEEKLYLYSLNDELVQTLYKEIKGTYNYSKYKSTYIYLIMSLIALFIPNSIISIIMSISSVFLAYLDFKFIRIRKKLYDAETEIFIYEFLTSTFGKDYTKIKEERKNKSIKIDKNNAIDVSYKQVYEYKKNKDYSQTDSNIQNTSSLSNHKKRLKTKKYNNYFQE